MTHICRRYLISGRVQGVFYRGSAQQQALQLGLCGWVRNLSDGRVECLACGEQKSLEILEKWLEIGPQAAKVTNIKSINETLDQWPDGFEVRPTA